MRLLLAEDEEELSEALTAVLRRNNYSVDAVYNGQDALDYAEGQEYDGIILDIMMPKKSGLEVLRTLRAHKNQVPVLLLTAKTQVDDRVEGLDSGADDDLGPERADQPDQVRFQGPVRPALLHVGEFGIVVVHKAAQEGGFGIAQGV